MGEFITQPVMNPTYITPMWFETNYDFVKWSGWMRDNWSLSVYFSIAYVGLIFIGKKFMENRPAYKLKGPLLVWNFGLAIFSILATIRTVPELNEFLFRTPNGLHKSICSIENVTNITLFWQLQSVLSKAVELGDTFFIVVRKQPLIFLHWYHHTTVMLYTWYTYASQDPVHRWFATVNFGIHALMYSYYFLKAWGTKLPRNLSMLITSLQIIQMVMGISTNFYTLFAMSKGWTCDRRMDNIILALLMYFSYFILFANFFYQAYFNSNKRGKIDSKLKKK